MTDPATPRRVLVLADDLIWSTRLAGHVRSTGLEAGVVRTADAFGTALAEASTRAAIVDLTSRAYDGLAAIAAARDARVPVLAVGQHDDHVLRRNALAVGADRVLAYRKLFEDGQATIARWLAETEPGAATATGPGVAATEPRVAPDPDLTTTPAQEVPDR